MPREILPILGVSQVFGPAFTGGDVGVVKTEGQKNEYEIHLTGEVLATRILSPVVIPAGSVVTKAYVRVTQAFNLAASSVVRVGTKGSEAANGVALTEAQLEAVGYVDVTAALAGTYDNEAVLAANSTLGVAFSAGSVTDRNVGRATLVIETVRLIA
jgi:hypothetical protein